MSPGERLKARLAARELLLGTFLKTPHPAVVEVLGAAGLDFLVLDGEHAPFDRAATDACLLAGRAVGCPLLVRVPAGDAATILGVLDGGAAGVMVPHVTSAGQAAALAAAVRYGPGGRGFAATTRAAGYGRRGIAEHLRRTPGEVSLICQIEDPEALDHVAAIAATEGVDGIFVGRADLAVGLGEAAMGAGRVAGLAAGILAATGAATGLYCAPGEDIAPWVGHGASFVVAGSDHAFLQQGAGALALLRNSVPTPGGKP